MHFTIKDASKPPFYTLKIILTKRDNSYYFFSHNKLVKYLPFISTLRIQNSCLIINVYAFIGIYAFIN